MIVINNYHVIKQDGFDVIYSGDDYEGNLRFEGIISDQDKGVIYSSRYYYDKEYWPNYYQENFNELKIIGNWLHGQVKSIAQKKLDRYIDNNIDNTDFYTGEKGLFNTIPLYKYSQSHVLKGPNQHLNLKEIFNGLAYVTVDEGTYLFDFASMKFIDSFCRNDEDKKPDLFNIFYNNTKDLLLAFEQLKKDKAHPAFAELMSLDDFFEKGNKKSIRMITKDNQEFKYTEEPGFFILDYENGRFMVKPRYRWKPGLKDSIPFSEVKMFKYGHNEFKIDHDKFKGVE